MRSIFHRRQRQQIVLLACGALPPAERQAAEDHLSICPACREYFAQIKAVSANLTTWSEALPQVQPGEATQQRWQQAVRATTHPAPVHRLTPAAALQEWAREVIWPWRRAWGGLALVWMMILAGNLSLREHSPMLTAKSSSPPQAMVMAFRDQQRILAELLADHSLPREADRPRFLSPKPRAQSVSVATA